MSGTEEGREIVERLSGRGEGVVTTVATEYGHEIYEKIGLGHLCIQGRLDIKGLSELIRDKNIKTLIDATHPYAAQASLNAIKVSGECGIKYIRFQRPSSVSDSAFSDEAAIKKYESVHFVKNMDEAVKWCRKSDRKNILLTTGFSSVEKFVKLKDEKNIYVRMLPMPVHIEQCVKMGIKSSNILAIQGPFSLELNKAIFNQYHIDVVVTKDSGKTGGVPEKIQAAIEMGIDTVVIEREEIDYPVICSSIDEVFCMLGMETV
jgi:precorrin-6A/cobalt-precorrin-6A reductase